MHQPKAVGPWSSPLSPWALKVELEVHPFHWRVKPASSVALTSLFSQLLSFGGRHWTHPHQLLRSSWCWSRTGPSQWGTSRRHDELLPIVSSQGRQCSGPWGLHPVPKLLPWLFVETKVASRWHARHDDESHAILARVGFLTGNSHSAAMKKTSAPPPTLARYSLSQLRKAMLRWILDYASTNLQLT